MQKQVITMHTRQDLGECVHERNIPTCMLSQGGHCYPCTPSPYAWGYCVWFSALLIAVVNVHACFTFAGLPTPRHLMHSMS